MTKIKTKTHKATSKVFKLKKNGTLVYKKSNGNHNTSKDTAKEVRQRRKPAILNRQDTKRLKSVIAR